MTHFYKRAALLLCNTSTLTNSHAMINVLVSKSRLHVVYKKVAGEKDTTKNQTLLRTNSLPVISRSNLLSNCITQVLFSAVKFSPTAKVWFQENKSF